MIHIFLLLCFASQTFTMKPVKEQSIELFKQNNWENRFAQLTTDQKNQLGLYVTAYANLPLAKESVPQFLLNGLGEVELENDKLNAQKILFEGINTDNSTLVAYAFARGANSNSEQNNRLPLAQALLVSSDELCDELLLEHKAEVSKELVQNAIYLEKTALANTMLNKGVINNIDQFLIEFALQINTKVAWSLLQKGTLDINMKFNKGRQSLLLSTYAMLNRDFETALSILEHENSSLEEFKDREHLYSIISQLNREKNETTINTLLSVLVKKKCSLDILWQINSLYLEEAELPSLIIKNLLEHKADINYKINYNPISREDRPIINEIIRSLKEVPLILSPLTLAMLFSRTRTVGLLVEHGADVNQKITISKDYNKKGSWNFIKHTLITEPITISPLECAIHLGKSEIAKLLTLKGAK